MDDINIKFFIDVEAIADQFAGFKDEIEQDLTKSVKGLALTTNAMVVEKANNELHSTREKYLGALKFEEVNDGVWLISLEQEALFIEEGLPENFDMKPGLLKNAKTSKSGVRYKVIPFDHTAAPNTQTIRARTVTDYIKNELKQQNIPFKKIETDFKGSPRVGKVHADLKLGGPIPGKGNTPIGENVNIYQTKNAQGKMRRDITTFRTVTSDQHDKFLHPGLEAKKYMDRAFEEAYAIWENEILPEIIKKWSI